MHGLLVPFVAWLVILWHDSPECFVPRMAQLASTQADARSLITGRITDAYSNIATVKLFSHGGREAALCQVSHARVYGHCACANSLGQLILELLNHSIQYALGRRHCSFECRSVAARFNWCRSGGSGRLRWRLRLHWFVALDYVGSDHALSKTLVLCRRWHETLSVRR